MSNTISKIPQTKETSLTLKNLTNTEKTAPLKTEQLCNSNSAKTLDDFFRSQQLMTPINIEIAARKHKWKTRPPAETGCFWPLVYTCPKGTRQTTNGCHMGQVRCKK